MLPDVVSCISGLHENEATSRVSTEASGGDVPFHSRSITRHTVSAKELFVQRALRFSLQRHAYM